MALILAIEPDPAQAAQVTHVVCTRLGQQLVLAATAEHALVAIGDRVPDLVLIPALLSPQEDAALAGAFRVIAAAARVPMLTIPVLVESRPAPARTGLLAKWRRGRGAPAAAEGCDPAIFGEQIAAYLPQSGTESGLDATEVETTPIETPSIETSAVETTEVETTEVETMPAIFAAEAVVIEPALVTVAPLEEKEEAAMAELAGPLIAASIEETVLPPLVEAIAPLILAPVVESVAIPIVEPIAALAPEPIIEPIAVTIAEPLAAPMVEPIAAPFVEPIAVTIDEPVQMADARVPAEAQPSPAASEPIAVEVLAALAPSPAAEIVATVAAVAPQAPASEIPATYVSQADLDLIFFQRAGYVWSPDEGRLHKPGAEAAAAFGHAQAASSASRRAAPPAPPQPEPPPAPPERPEWLELIESLRLDIERLRAERAQPAPVAQARVIMKPSRRERAASAPRSERRAAAERPKQPRPIQDQWGLFDPDQCGFAALIAKLEEITEANEEMRA